MSVRVSVRACVCETMLCECVCTRLRCVRAHVRGCVVRARVCEAVLCACACACALTEGAGRPTMAAVSRRPTRISSSVLRAGEGLCVCARASDGARRASAFSSGIVSGCMCVSLREHECVCDSGGDEAWRCSVVVVVVGVAAAGAHSSVCSSTAWTATLLCGARWPWPALPASLASTSTSPCTPGNQDTPATRARFDAGTRRHTVTCG